MKIRNINCEKVLFLHKLSNYVNFGNGFNQNLVSTAKFIQSALCSQCLMSRFWNSTPSFDQCIRWKRFNYHEAHLAASVIQGQKFKVKFTRSNSPFVFEKVITSNIIGETYPFLFYRFIGFCRYHLQIYFMNFMNKFFW